MNDDNGWNEARLNYSNESSENGFVFLTIHK